MKRRLFILISIGIISVVLMGACTPAQDAVQVDEPAPVENEEATPEDSASENSLQETLGECYNPFNPVIEGRTWNYRIDANGEITDFKVYYTNINSDGFTRVVEFPDLTTETNWTCGPEGLASLEYGTLTTSGLQNLGITTKEVNGVSIPPADQWQVGNSWQVEYIAEVSFAMGESSFVGQGNITLDFAIADVVDVTITAGDYSNAFLVDTTINVTVDVAGSATTLSTTSNDWYVENVGLVKSESTDPNFTFTMELVSFE